MIPLQRYSFNKALQNGFSWREKYVCEGGFKGMCFCYEPSLLSLWFHFQLCSWFVSRFIVSLFSTEKNVMQHPIYLGKYCFQGNLNTNILILYTEACFVEEGECIVHMGCNSSHVKHIPQTARFVLLFYLPLMKLIPVCGEDCVVFQRRSCCAAMC